MQRDRHAERPSQAEEANRRRVVVVHAELDFAAAAGAAGLVFAEQLLSVIAPAVDAGAGDDPIRVLLPGLENLIN